MLLTGTSDLTIFVCFLPPHKKENSLLEIEWIWMPTPLLTVCGNLVSLPLSAQFFHLWNRYNRKKMVQTLVTGIPWIIYSYIYNLPPISGILEDSGMTDSFFLCFFLTCHWKNEQTCISVKKIKRSDISIKALLTCLSPSSFSPKIKPE